MSPEGIETMKTAGLTGALFGGIGGAISSKSYLKSGYADSVATTMAKDFADQFKEGKEKLNSEKLDNLKNRLETIYDIDTKNMSTEDIIRNAIALENEKLDATGDMGASIFNANKVLKELVGETTARDDHSTETTRRMLSNYDYAKYLD